MMARRYLFLYISGLTVAFLASSLQRSPGYMDADYYFLGGIRLADGHGFTEPVLWNFLDDPQGLPHPSHAYWMPLASLLSAVGLKLSGLAPGIPLDSFPTARFGFLVLLGLLAPLTAHLSFSLTEREDLATLAGLLAVFPGFYLPFLTTTDTFMIYMILGTLFLQVAWIAARNSVEGNHGIRRLAASAPFLLGILAGTMHLARADGALWVGIGVLAIIIRERAQDHRSLPGRFGWMVLQLSFLLSGYLMVMGPWILRNIFIFGTPLAPGGIRTLWLTDYNEIFTYPAVELTPARWLQSGIGTIIKLRIKSIGLSLGGALAVQGLVFLVPLILVGLRRLKDDIRVQLAVVAWILTFLVMTLAFSESGWRGGFFHSGAAVQPLLWAVAPVGLDAFVRWGARRRNWQPHQARLVFGWGIVIFAAVLSVFSIQERVLGEDLQTSFWDESADTYRRVELRLQGLGAQPQDVVLVNNPPGYFIASGRSAIVIPNGNMETLRVVARHYGVRYLILEPNHPLGIDELYVNPQAQPGLAYLQSEGDVHIFKFGSD